MNTILDLNPRVKAREKFYNKIRNQLAEIDLPDQSTLIRKDLDGSKFGQIPEKHTELISAKYEQQQTSSESKSKPVKCDIPCGSYAKLLFSKPAFHNPGSTGYLVEHLYIKDHNRNSFLGGPSNYDVREDDKLEKHRDKQLFMFIRNENKRVFQLLDENKIQEAENLHRELFKLDPQHPDSLAGLGRFQFIVKDYKKSIESYRSALTSGCADPNYVSKHLSSALFQDGFSYFQRHDYQQAANIFSLALAENPENNDALLHKNLCEDKIRNRYTPSYKRSHYERRK